MRWEDERESDNVEDLRGTSFSRGAKVGGIGGLGVVILVVVGMVMGVNPSDLLRMLSGTQTVSVSPQQQKGGQAANDEMKRFVAVVLGETEDVWSAAFRQVGRTYQMPKLVLYTRSVNSACGMAGSATGPFYCPGDHKVYLDLSFFREMRTRLGVSGDFAQAYVIAHEVGHHVQTLLGVSDKVRRLQARSSPTARNRLSVMMELQADCLAGVWAHQIDTSRRVLEPGDIEEGLRAASAVGDDRLQKMSQGYVVPDSFTHGSSEQRVRWFKKGFESGSMNGCNTFRADRL